MYMAIFIHTQQIKTSLYPNDCILSKTFNMFSYRQYQHLDKRLNLILWNAKNKNHTLYILICEILDSCFNLSYTMQNVICKNKQSVLVPTWRKMSSQNKNKHLLCLDNGFETNKDLSKANGQFM